MSATRSFYRNNALVVISAIGAMYAPLSLFFSLLLDGHAVLINNSSSAPASQLNVSLIVQLCCLATVVLVGRIVFVGVQGTITRRSFVILGVLVLASLIAYMLKGSLMTTGFMAEALRSSWEEGKWRGVFSSLFNVAILSSIVVISGWYLVGQVLSRQMAGETAANKRGHAPTEAASDP